MIARNLGGKTPDNTKPVEGTIPNTVSLVGGTTTDTKKHVGEGYLVCGKCNGYYKLQAGESPEDFESTCECGGKLEYRDRI